MSQDLQDRLDEKGVRPIDDHTGLDLYWFVVMDVKQKLTKNKKQYLLITAAGLGGNVRMFCWGWDGETDLPLYSICVAEVDRNDFGHSTKMWKLKVLN